MSYLELKNLSKRYTKNGNLVVNNLNLTIDKGEFVVFLGPSGCGKTTTIRMISGLEEVTDGDIILENESIINKETKNRGISMIFQSYAVWPHMTVYDNIAYPLKLRKMEKIEIDRIVREVATIAEIDQFLDRYPSQLSGGQKQRTAVARAIAIKPKIFLMDEPLSNLVAKLRVAVRTDLREIHNKLNATTIFVTHDQSEAMSLADRIVVMKNGEIEQVGTPNEVYHQSETIFVASFIGSPPTNFIEFEVATSNDDVFLVNNDYRYRLKDKKRDLLKLYNNKNIIVGIRPEKFQVHLSDPKSTNSIKTKIDIVEPQGSHTIIVCELLGKTIKIITNEYLNIKANTIIYIDFIEEDLLCFDKSTERLIK